MTRPGDRLRALAARACSASTMERLIDPIVADLQAEYRDADRQGRVWTRRSIRIMGGVGLAKALALHGCDRLAAAPREWTADDQQAVRRMLGWSLGAAMTMTLLMVMPALVRIPSMVGRVHSITPFQTSEPVFFASFLATLIPSAVPLSIPVGLMFGMFCGLADRRFSRRVALAMLGVAMVGSLASFVTWAWVVPASNQVFRTTVFGGDLAKGVNELTLGELGHQLDAVNRGELVPLASNARDIADVAFTYHAHWAFPCASLALATLSLTLMAHRPMRRPAGAASACGLLLGYYALLFATRTLGLDGTLPPMAAAWLPNLIVALLSASLFVVASRQPHRPSPSSTGHATARL